jgi:hypothetical protein
LAVGIGELLAGQTSGSEAALLWRLFAGSEDGEGLSGDAGDVLALLLSWFVALSDRLVLDGWWQRTMVAPPGGQRLTRLGEVRKEPALTSDGC